MTGPTTSHLQQYLDRLRAGDPAARGDLLRHSQGRLRALTARMLSRFPAVRRWEETDDVFQDVLLRLDRLLSRVEVGTVRDYLRLAATNIRQVLIDLVRHYQGPLGLGANHASPVPAGPCRCAREELAGPACDSTDDARRLVGWAEFHAHAARLAGEEAEVFDLLWYHGLSQDEAGRVLGVSLSTVKRRWQSARLAIMEAFGGETPF